MLKILCDHGHGSHMNMNTANVIALSTEHVNVKDVKKTKLRPLIIPPFLVLSVLSYYLFFQVGEDITASTNVLFRISKQ